MNFLGFKKHPIIFATTLAFIIAIFNYIMLTLFFDYADIIFDIDIPNGRSLTKYDFPPPPPKHTPHISFAINQLVSNFILALVLYAINFYNYAKIETTTSKRIILSIIISILITIVFCIISINIDFYLRMLQGYHVGGPKAKELIRSAITRDTIVLLTTSLSSILIYFIDKQERSKIEKEILIAENLRSQYNALTAQLNPHFLFNSLNTLKALIKLNPEKAQEYTQQLSDIFRYTTKNKEVITVEEEIEFSQTYGNMMLMRYENNLNIVYNIDSVHLPKQILPFSIQTLIENAIKHNTISMRKPLTIEIFSDEAGKIVVRNLKSPKRDLGASNGLGLKNLNDRYKYQFKQEIEILNSQEYFEVKIPTFQIENITNKSVKL